MKAEVSPAQPVRHASMAVTVMYVLAYFAVYVALITPVVSTLALKVNSVSDATTRTSDLGLVTAVGAFMAFVMNPLAGALSDRTTSRLGMRKPWLIGGFLAGAVGLILLAVAPNVLVVAVVWGLTQGALNATLAALQAILPDQIAENLRGRVSGMLGIGQNLAPLVGIGLAFGMSAAGVSIFWMILVPLAIGAVGIGLFGFDEPTALSWQLRVSVLQTSLIVISAMVGGWLTDRTGRRTIFVIVSSILGGLGLLTFAFATGPEFLYLAGIFMGLDKGCYFAVDLALITDILPNSETEAAKNLGVFNIANALPHSLAPAVAPLILAIGSSAGQTYSLLFAAVAAIVIIGRSPPCSSAASADLVPIKVPHEHHTPPPPRHSMSSRSSAS